jgi:hypothetical protein
MQEQHVATLVVVLVVEVDSGDSDRHGVVRGSLFCSTAVTTHAGSRPIVYDDPQPATGLDVLAIEPLAVRNGVQGPVVRASDCAQDDIDVVEQPGTPLPQMQSGANVEHYLPPVGVTRPT